MLATAILRRRACRRSDDVGRRIGRAAHTCKNNFSVAISPTFC